MTRAGLWYAPIAMKRWIPLAALLALGATALAQPPQPAPPTAAPGETPGRPPGTPVPSESPEDDESVPLAGNANEVWRAVPTVDPSTVLASGRGVRITVADLVARLHDATGALMGDYVLRPGAVDELIDRMVSDRVLADEARRQGLENDPLVRAAIERILVARLRARTINPAADGERPTDDEVRAWYDAHPERFHFPERRRVRLMFFRARRDAQAALSLALLRRRGRPVHDVRRLAGERNDDPALRSMNGDVRDVTRVPFPGGLVLDAAVRAAAFEIVNDGDTLPRLVEGRWRDEPGFFVVNLVSRRRPEERSLRAQADWIRLRIVMQRRVDAERARVEALLRERRVTRAATAAEVVRFEPAPPDLDAGLDAGR